MVYYNEFDKFAASWLRELIKAKQIAEGEVDERSIVDVRAGDLRGFAQHHFFAGIGVWSYALKCAGWPDTRPVWTGSCPCQPFSTAGKKEGFTDPRHLWPEWFRLIREYRPIAVFGEQVEAAVRQGWFDLVSGDMEGEGYTIGAAIMGAHSVGAPHIRQRLYFVANSECGATERFRFNLGTETREVESAAQERERVWDDFGDGCSKSGVAHNSESGLERPARESVQGRSERFAKSSGMGNNNKGLSGRLLGRDGSNKESVGSPSLVNGFWRDAEWIYCRDEKYRPVEPGTFPLVNGSTNRVGRLRGYGNAIVAPTAQAFIEAYLSSE